MAVKKFKKIYQNFDYKLDNLTKIFKCVILIFIEFHKLFIIWTENIYTSFFFNALPSYKECSLVKDNRIHHRIVNCKKLLGVEK